MVSAFEAICSSIAYACCITIPTPDDDMSIITDASGKGIGGILQVKREDMWEPAGFFSRQLRGAEFRYSATETEVLVLVETIKHFAYYLYGRRFTAWTDHKLIGALTEEAHLNTCLKRMSCKLQPWWVDIKYLPGDENTLADALSRQELFEPDSFKEDGVLAGMGSSPYRSEWNLEAGRNLYHYIASQTVVDTCMCNKGHYCASHS